MSEVADLFKRIEGLSVPDRLRLAAGLLEGGQQKLAAQLVRRTHEEFTLTEVQAALAARSTGAGKEK